MNILILQGPNVNLLGLKSSKIGKRLTLDKLNRAIKKFSKDNGINIKTLQTHKQFQAINFLQRNRNWASGVLIIPTSWARNDYTILETINLIQLKTVAIYFEEEFSFGTHVGDSIFDHENISSITGHPKDACFRGLEYLSS